MREVMMSAAIAAALMVGPAAAQSSRPSLESVLAECNSVFDSSDCRSMALRYANGSDADVEYLAERLIRSATYASGDRCDDLRSAMDSIDSMVSRGMRRELRFALEDDCRPFGFGSPSDDDVAAVPNRPNTPSNPDPDPDPGTPGGPGWPHEPGGPGFPEWPGMPTRPTIPSSPTLASPNVSSTPGWPSWDQGNDGRMR